MALTCVVVVHTAAVIDLRANLPHLHSTTPLGSPRRNTATTFGVEEKF